MLLDINVQLVFQVLVTHRAGQALDAMSAISNRVLNSYDGVLAVVRTKKSTDMLLITHCYSC